MVTDAVGVTAGLDEQKATDADGLIARRQAMAAAGERFVILDLPADLVDQRRRRRARISSVTLINATAHEDFLRERCYPNLLHTAASDRMLADALAQLLRIRNWTHVLMLVGPEPRDKAMADSFAASAKRLRLDIVDTPPIHPLDGSGQSRGQQHRCCSPAASTTTWSTSPTAMASSRATCPTRPSLPRPVIGPTGLTAAEWHWSWDRDGATQVTSRFDQLTDGRQMSGADWSTWIAAKAVRHRLCQVAARPIPTRSTPICAAPRFSIDGSKGVQHELPAMGRPAAHADHARRPTTR